MAVIVKLNLPLQRLAGNREKIEVNGSTVKECLDEIIKQIPGAKKEIFSAEGLLTILFLINNETINEQDLNHTLGENDELWLLSVVSGG